MVGVVVVGAVLIWVVLVGVVAAGVVLVGLVLGLEFGVDDFGAVADAAVDDPSKAVVSSPIKPIAAYRRERLRRPSGVGSSGTK